MPETENNVVLVADDEPSTRELVANHLRSRGYQVVEASDGDEAWELAQEHLPNLIILDVMMPGMSGWEVCRRIREAVSLAHTGVIMLTGIGEHLNAMTSPLYGADAYVDKPFEFRDLDEKVAESLASRSRGILGRPDGADVEPPSGSPPESVEYLAETVSAPATAELLEPPTRKRPAGQRSGSARRARATAKASQGKRAAKASKGKAAARPTQRKRAAKASKGKAAAKPGQRKRVAKTSQGKAAAKPRQRKRVAAKATQGKRPKRKAK